MAFIKSADNRRDASFAVSSGKSRYHEEEPEDEAETEAASISPDEDLSNWEVWQP
jgi:hypothetical protein